MVLVHLLDPVGTWISILSKWSIFSCITLKQNNFEHPFILMLPFVKMFVRIRHLGAFPPVIWCPHDPIQRYSWNLQPRRLWAKKTWLGLKLSVGHAAVLQTEHNLSWAKDSFIRFIYHRHIHIPIYTYIHYTPWFSLRTKMRCNSINKDSTDMTILLRHHKPVKRKTWFGSPEKPFTKRCELKIWNKLTFILYMQHIW